MHGFFLKLQYLLQLQITDYQFIILVKFWNPNNKYFVAKRLILISNIWDII